MFVSLNNAARIVSIEQLFQSRYLVSASFAPNPSLAREILLIWTRLIVISFDVRLYKSIWLHGVWANNCNPLPIGPGVRMGPNLMARQLAKECYIDTLKTMSWPAKHRKDAERRQGNHVGYAGHETCDYNYIPKTVSCWLVHFEAMFE